MSEDPQQTNNGEQTQDTEAMKQKMQEYLDGWKRAKADHINYQKDEQKRFAEFAQYSNEALIREMLTVLDSFDLASASMDDKNPAHKGIQMIRAQFDNILKKQGLEKITPENIAFDPRFHEAVAEVESDKEHGTIVEVVSPGYILNGKVIRAARVVIAK